MKKIKQIIINGYAITDKQSLYAAFDRQLKPDADWSMAESLDALDDVLYGGYGLMEAGETVQLIWKNFDANAALFGVDFTIAFYEQKLQFPKQFNADYFKNAIQELKAGRGKTYFDIILEIIADHPNIELIKE